MCVCIKMKLVPDIYFLFINEIAKYRIGILFLSSQLSECEQTTLRY